MLILLQDLPNQTTVNFVLVSIGICMDLFYSNIPKLVQSVKVLCSYKSILIITSQKVTHVSHIVIPCTMLDRYTYLVPNKPQNSHTMVNIRLKKTEYILLHNFNVFIPFRDFRTKPPLNFVLVSVGTYGSLQSKHTKMSTIR